MTEQIIDTVKKWILKNGNPQVEYMPPIHITKLEYKNGSEVIDVDLIWIRSRGKYDRVEYNYNGKLVKAELKWS